MAKVFDEKTTPDENHDYLSDFVGEGKKFQSVEDAAAALAKSKVHGDAHISQLEAELAELRSEVNARQTLAELRDQIATARTQTTTQEVNHTQDVEPGQNPQNQPIDVEKVVSSELDKREQVRRAEANEAHVRDVLERSLGPGYTKAAAEKAKAVGVGLTFLNDLAKSSPSAVFAILGVTEQPKPIHNPVQTGVRPVAPSTDGKKRLSYYEKLRKEQPALYKSLAVQKEKMAAAFEMGDDFIDI